MREFFLATFVALLLASSASAAGLPRPAVTGNIVEDIKTDVQNLHPKTAVPDQVTSSTNPDILNRLKTVVLADLKAASADAHATADTIAAPCLDAWIGLIEAQQKAQAAPLPDPHVITTFQQDRDLVNALRPGAPLRTACAPLAEELKQDVLTLLSKIAGGVLTVPAMLAPFGL